MKKWTTLALVFCFCALVFGTLTWKLNTSSGITISEAYSQKIRNGLAEIKLPTKNDTASINDAPDRLSNFIRYRSGVELSESNKNILRAAEQNAWDNSKRVDAAALTQIISDIAIERIPKTGDAEITALTDSLRGFDAPGLPADFQKSRSRLVKLRASGIVNMPADDFKLELTKLRDGGIQSRIAKNLIYVSLTNEVNRCVNTLRQADPKFFGGTQSRMTPAQALLVTYAVVADDALTNNQAELAQKMQDMQQLNSKVVQGDFPSSYGQKAFGDNGYLYSSPTSILLNDASVERLLTLIQERGN